MGTKYFILFFFIVGCSTSNNFSENLNIENGVFIQKQDGRYELHIDNNKFVFLNASKGADFSYYDCCDTISYGNWKKDKRGFIELTTPEEWDTNILNMEVVEKDLYSKDTLYFIIDNPIEKRYMRTKRKNRDINYLVEIGSNNEDISEYFRYTTHAQNIIKVPITKDFEIDFVELTIYIQPDIRLKYKNVDVINTLQYNINNKRNNVFFIDIPKLDYNYISFKRLNSDYVKIVDREKLFWDGKEYIKKK